MGKTFRKEANPERVARVQELRRSSAAGPINRRTTKRATREDAIMESFEEYVDADRTEEMYDEGYDDYRDCED